MAEPARDEIHSTDDGVESSTPCIHPTVIMLRVEQTDEEVQLPSHQFDEKLIPLKFIKHTGEDPAKVNILNNSEEVIEFVEGVSLTEVAMHMFECIEWSGYSVKVNYWLLHRSKANPTAEASKVKCLTGSQDIIGLDSLF